MERVVIVKARVGEKAQLTSIPKTNGIVEELIGGYVDEIVLPEFQEAGLENVWLICHEEGFLFNFPVNRMFHNLIHIRGTFIVVKKMENGTITSLSSEEYEKILKIVNLAMVHHEATQ